MGYRHARIGTNAVLTTSAVHDRLDHHARKTSDNINRRILHVEVKKKISELATNCHCGVRNLTDR